MTANMSMPCRSVAVGWWRRVAVRVITLASLCLARLSPARLRVLMTWAAVGAIPAEYEHAEWAYNAVVASSPQCAGWKGCLPRSIAVCLLCRLKGQWPEWCCGVRSTLPFTAHAWVQADSRVVAEPGTLDAYRPLIKVGAVHERA
jgi:Transglutaminase-like superfamily